MRHFLLKEELWETTALRASESERVRYAPPSSEIEGDREGEGKRDREGEGKRDGEWEGEGKGTGSAARKRAQRSECLGVTQTAPKADAFGFVHYPEAIGDDFKILSKKCSKAVVRTKNSILRIAWAGLGKAQAAPPQFPQSVCREQAALRKEGPRAPLRTLHCGQVPQSCLLAGSSRGGGGQPPFRGGGGGGGARNQTLTGTVAPIGKFISLRQGQSIQSILCCSCIWRIAIIYGEASQAGPSILKQWRSPLSFGLTRLLRAQLHAGRMQANPSKSPWSLARGTFRGVWKEAVSSIPWLAGHGGKPRVQNPQWSGCPRV